MSKRRKIKGSDKVPVTYRGVGMGLLGGLTALGSNYLVAMGADKMGLDPEQRKTANLLYQGAKIAGGGYAAANPRLSGDMRMFGAGVAVEGGIELGIGFSEGRLSIAGTELFQRGIGTGDLIDLSNIADDYDPDEIATSVIDYEDFDDEF